MLGLSRFFADVGRSAQMSRAAPGVSTKIKEVTAALRKTGGTKYKAERVKALQIIAAQRRTAGPTASGSPQSVVPIPRFIVRAVLPIQTSSEVQQYVQAELNKYPKGRAFIQAKDSRTFQVLIEDSTTGAHELGVIRFREHDPKAPSHNIFKTPAVAKMEAQKFELTIPTFSIPGDLQAPSVRDQGRNRRFTELGR
jgi:hypothetical protein